MPQLPSLWWCQSVCVWTPRFLPCDGRSAARLVISGHRCVPADVFHGDSSCRVPERLVPAFQPDMCLKRRVSAS